MRGRVCTPCPVGPTPGLPFSSLLTAAARPPLPRIHWGILIFLLSALREPHPQMCFPFLVSPSKPLLRVPPQHLPTRGLCEGKDDLSFQIGLPEGRVSVSLFSWGASRGPTRTSSQEHPPHFPWLVGLTLAGDLLPSSWASAQRAVSADSQWDPGIPQVDD